MKHWHGGLSISCKIFKSLKAEALASGWLRNCFINYLTERRFFSVILTSVAIDECEKQNIDKLFSVFAAWIDPMSFIILPRIYTADWPSQRAVWKLKHFLTIEIKAATRRNISLRDFFRHFWDWLQQKIRAFNLI